MSPQVELAAALAAFSLPKTEIQQRQIVVQSGLLARSKHVRKPNFDVIHPRDLQLLFESYDEHFLSGRVKAALGTQKLRMRLSKRMTRTGGTTARFRVRATGEVFYEITVATSMLFDSFLRPDDREVTVTGIPCHSRIEALQRIFEHELVHLAELLCFETSNCSAPRFQDIAARLFLHEAHTHQLVTRVERAAKAGLLNGAWVEFTHEGRRYRGRVRRVTKRATVLVEDPAGQPFTDGKRYRTWYVPLEALTPVQAG